MNHLFTEYPKIFAILEELNHYTGLVVIPTNIIPFKFRSFPDIDTTYPSISIMNVVLSLISPILQTLSADFLLMMMKNHRLIKTMKTCINFNAQDLLLHCWMSVPSLKINQSAENPTS